MDSELFDAMTRLMATRLTRRGALRALAGSLVGSAAALVGGTAGAEPEGRRCPALQACGEICCPPESTGCTAATTLPDGTVLPPGCLCPAGTFYERIANHCTPCGGNGAGCAVDDDCCNSTCCYGMCQETCEDCPPGLTFCHHSNGAIDDFCLNTEFDTYNCGSCGRACLNKAGNPIPCTSGECGCAEIGSACRKDWHCCLGRCAEGICRACVPPGSACSVDTDCCGHDGSGRCIDGACRCCTYHDMPSHVCDGLIDPADVICCDYPLDASWCLNRRTGDCIQVCGNFCSTGDQPVCPSGYSPGQLPCHNWGACADGY